MPSDLPTFDFDRAMRIYLGGPFDEPGIQPGLREERLAAEFGDQADSIEPLLDAVLAAAERQADAHGLRKLDESLTHDIPHLSPICRRKIASHVQYQWR